MKRTMQTWFLVGAALVAALLSGCASTRGVVAGAVISAQAEKTADNYRIVDWAYRGTGGLANPEWISPAAMYNNWELLEATSPKARGKVLHLSVGTNAKQNVAMTIAEVQYAARLANQLKQAVLTRAGIDLADDGEFDAVSRAVTQAQVTLTGQERLVDFWQQIEKTDDKGKKTTQYQYYIVYACDESTWDQVTAKFIFDVVGQLPEKKTQTVIAGMFNELSAATKNETPKTEAQFKAEVAAQQAALDKGGMNAAEQRAAYRSGDPAKIAAAGTTKADTDYVAALMILANQ